MAWAGRCKRLAKRGSLVTGGSAVDMIDMVEYDVFGRERFKYLLSPSTASDTTKNDGLFKLNLYAGCRNYAYEIQ